MIAGLLLAAGGARRFGTQKLLAPLDGVPLVRHTAGTLAGAVDTLVVVVGHDAERVQRALSDLRPKIAVNKEWRGGLSMSLRVGARALPRDAESVVIALGDQPLGDSGVVHAVVEQWRVTGALIVAPRYYGTRGHPVLFARAVFPELERQTGDIGARGVIDRDLSRVVYVDIASPLPADIDTPEDLKRVQG